MTDESTSPARRLARLSLFLSAIAFGGFGVVLLVYPQLLGVVGVEATRAAGVVELRGFYGGLELGLAAFFALALSRHEWHRPALLVQILSLGGMAAGRAVGLLAGGGEALIYMLMATEAAGSGVGVVALRVLERGRTVVGRHR